MKGLVLMVNLNLNGLVLFINDGIFWGFVVVDCFFEGEKDPPPPLDCIFFF